MAELMTLARFRNLADAYGGVVARWPDQEREAATPLALSQGGQKVLAAASALDQELDTWCVPAPSAALRDRVLSSAPRPRQSVVKRARLWWSGVGVVAALTGAAAGAVAVAVIAPIEASPDRATSFGDVVAQES